MFSYYISSLASDLVICRLSFAALPFLSGVALCSISDFSNLCSKPLSFSDFFLRECSISERFLENWTACTGKTIMLAFGTPSFCLTNLRVTFLLGVYEEPYETVGDGSS